MKFDDKTKELLVSLREYFYNTHRLMRKDDYIFDKEKEVKILFERFKQLTDVVPY